jgi:hypothetical protein
MTDLLPEPAIDPYAELTEVTVYGRQWGKDPESSRPAPVITSQQTFDAGWCWWPSPVTALEKRATRLGWMVRVGFARGYKRGIHKDTWALLDTVGVWLAKPGAPRAAFVWKRSPDGADSSYEWKPAVAMIWGKDGKAYACKHMAAKALIL